jgi:hypothetical protein
VLQISWAGILGREAASSASLSDRGAKPDHSNRRLAKNPIGAGENSVPCLQHFSKDQ